jgi:hypothetical protein
LTPAATPQPPAVAAVSRPQQRSVTRELCDQSSRPAETTRSSGSRIGPHTQQQRSEVDVSSACNVKAAQERYPRAWVAQEPGNVGQSGAGRTYVQDTNRDRAAFAPWPELPVQPSAARSQAQDTHEDRAATAWPELPIVPDSTPKRREGVGASASEAWPDLVPAWSSSGGNVGQSSLRASGGSV